MKKIIFFSFLFSSVFLSGCSNEELLQSYNDAKSIPAQTTINTIGQLVTAESLFSSPQYEYTPENLEKLFLQNEYFILVEDYTFFYCYDTRTRSFQGIDFNGNYGVIGINKFGDDLLIQGTPPFRAQWKDLKNISKRNRNPSQFESVLDIRDGTCFEIKLDEEYLQSLPQNKLLRKIPIDKSEWEKMRKELQNFTTPIEDLLDFFDSIHLKEKSEE